MKTERLTLLISPADKAALAARASSLDMSISELIRRAALDYDPRDAVAMEELAILVPELDAMASRIERHFAEAMARSTAHAEAMAAMPAYRDSLRETLAVDPTIDWSALGRLFGSEASASA